MVENFVGLTQDEGNPLAAVLHRQDGFGYPLLDGVAGFDVWFTDEEEATKRINAVTSRSRGAAVLHEGNVMWLYWRNGGNAEIAAVNELGQVLYVIDVKSHANANMPREQVLRMAEALALSIGAVIADAESLPDMIEECVHKPLRERLGR